MKERRAWREMRRLVLEKKELREKLESIQKAFVQQAIAMDNLQQTHHGLLQVVSALVRDKGIMFADGTAVVLLPEAALKSVTDRTALRREWKEGQLGGVLEITAYERQEEPAPQAEPPPPAAEGP